MSSSRAPVISHIDITGPARAVSLLRLVDYLLVYAGSATAVGAIPALCHALGSADWAGGLGELVLLTCSAGIAYIGYRSSGVLDERVWLALTWVLLLVVIVCPAFSGLLALSGELTWSKLERPEGFTLGALAFGAIWLAGAAFIALIALARLQRIRLAPLGLRVSELLARLRAQLSPHAPQRSFRERYRSPRGWLLAACGVSVLVAWVLAPMPDDVHWQKEVYRVGQYVNWLGCYLLLCARRYFLEPADELLAEDTRRPVLFLRSFDDDEKLKFQAADRALLDFSLETRLSHHFSAVGPFIAIGSPKDALPLPGAARVKLSDDKWQSQVLQWMRDARYIVMYSGKTHWVNWELQRVVESGRAHDLILLIPELKVWRKKKRTADLAARVQQLRDTFRDTPWEEELTHMADFANVRAMLFRPDGSMVMISSKNRSRDSYHLAALVAHQILLEPQVLTGAVAAPAPRPKLSWRSPKLWAAGATAAALAGISLYGYKFFTQSWALEKLVAQQTLGEEHVHAGRLEDARAAYAQMVEQARVMAARSSDVDTQHNLSVAYERLGGVLSQLGKLDDAAAACEQSSALAVQLVKQTPGDAAQAQLAFGSLRLLGAVRAAQNKLSDSQAAYQRALELGERGREHDAADVHQALAEVLTQETLPEEAARHYQQAAALLQQLIAAGTAPDEYQREALLCYEALGDLRVKEPQLSAAGDAYRSMLALATRRAEASPQDASLQRDVSVAYNKLGRVLRSEGKLGEAEAALKADVDISRRFAEAAPDDLDRQHDLLASCAQLGDVYVDKQELQNALAAFSCMLERGERLGAEGVRDRDRVWELAIAYRQVGDLQAALDKPVEASAAYAKLLETARRLAELGPADDDLQALMEHGTTRLAELAPQLRRGERALALAR